jgi:hypothetical protein
MTGIVIGRRHCFRASADDESDRSKPLLFRMPIDRMKIAPEAAPYRVDLFRVGLSRWIGDSGRLRYTLVSNL